MVRHQASLPCDISAGSRSRLNPPHGTKTSGGGSRPPRTSARTLPLVRTLLPPASASPSPERPTQSLPPPDVDSHATPAAFASLASPSVVDGSCQHSSARAMAAWPRCKAHGRGCPRASERGQRRSLDALGIRRAALERFRRTAELESLQLEGPRLGLGAQAPYACFPITSSIIPYSLLCSVSGVFPLRC